VCANASADIDPFTGAYGGTVTRAVVAAYAILPERNFFQWVKFCL
jgi:hypothetical protein